jgi:exodeoxyribonuclease VII large subunit
MADKNTNALELTVSELSFGLKKMVEDNFGYVRVRGELGRVSRPASGHIYLDLKDDKAVLNGVIWKGVASRLKHQPEEGLEIIATGKLTTFPGSSKYQIVIDNIEPAGAGALMALLEERKKKLTAEGLFDEGRKQLLPYLPKVIGVVTSPTGSVVRDVLHRLKDRFPLHVIVWPVRVQGESCAQEVSNAIHGFNAFQPGGPLPRPDIIIVARGGGSIEDLWGFNEESVVRAAADSQIPLISAVGHETDWTLIDLAADIRAPTPTAAAEMAVRVRADLNAKITTLGARLQTGIRRVLDMQKNHMRAAERGLSTPQSLLDIPRQRYDTIALRLGQGLATAANAKRANYEQIAARLSWYGLSNQVKSGFEKIENTNRRISRAIRHLLDKNTSKLEQADRLLGSLSYMSVLERGFAVIMDEKGKAITNTGTIRPNSLINIRMKDGEVKAQTLSTSTSTAKVSSAKRKPPALNQGDLF